MEEGSMASDEFTDLLDIIADPRATSDGKRAARAQIEAALAGKSAESLAGVRRAVEILAAEVAQARASSDAAVQWTKIMAVAAVAIAAMTFLLFLMSLFG
jgi:hypothetical protein